MEERGRSIRKFWVTLVESAFLAALLAVVVISALTALGHGSA
jgi:Flp pilus assembly pilin Flp